MLKFRHIALTSLLATLAANAAPLSAPTAVHTQPDANAPVITILSPGTSPTPAIDAMATTPAGWMAVQQPGPFESYVRNGDIDKSLNVKPGASIHLQPNATSGVLTTMEPGDKASITGLHGKWSQISLSKTVTGFIQVKGPAPAATTSATSTSSSPSSTVASSPAPQAASSADYIMPAASTSRDIPQANANDSGVLPRMFQGKFVSTRRPFTPRRPYDWQLNDAAGVRYAYLDISHLLLTDQIENYAGHDVVVYGTPKSMPDGRNIVIQIESLRLK